jgi:hypothetical protein
VNKWDGLIERLRNATDWKSPSEQREYDAHRRHVADARNWYKPPENEVEDELGVGDGEDSPHGEFVRQFAIPLESVDEGDPYEEGRVFLDAAERYDARLASEYRSLREVSAHIVGFGEEATGRAPDGVDRAGAGRFRQGHQ